MFPPRSKLLLVFTLLVTFASCKLVAPPTPNPPNPNPQPQPDPPRPSGLDITIRCDSAVYVGDFTKVAFEVSKGAKYDWDVVPEGEKTRFLALRDGDIVYIPGRTSPPSVFVVAAAANSKDMVIDVAGIDVLDGDPEPDPQPGPQPTPDPPGPQPTPDPPTPNDWVSELALMTRNLIVQHVRVTSKAVNLARVIEVVCNDPPGSCREFRERICEASWEVLEDDVDKWRPVSNGLAKRITEFAGDGTMDGVEDYQKAWKAIAGEIRRAGQPRSDEVEL